MSLPKMTTAVNNISQLDTRPNAVNGLTADQLKAEFDKGPEAIKRFLNEVLIPALDGAITLDALGAVPKTRTVAWKALSEDILLDASDIDYEATIDGTQVEDVETALGALKNAKSTVTFAVTKNANGTFTAGKTFAQLKAAYDAGKGLLCVYDNGAGTMWLPIGYESESAINFVKYTEVEQDDYQLVWLQVTDKDVWQEFSKHVNAESIAYSGTIDGTAVQDVDAALDALNAKKAVATVTVTATDGGATADMTLSQIVDAYGAGREVKCLLAEGSNSTLLSLLKISTTVARFYGQTSAAVGKVVTFLENGNVAVTQAEAQAANVKYSGKVGSDTVANVKAALDALAIGKPLDMTADYVASGAESVGQWIAMAATGSTTEYRVPCGTFLLRAVDGIYGMTIVTIFEEPDGNWRGAIDIKFTCDCDWEIRFWQGAAVGQTPDVAATFQVNNSGDISLNGANNLENLVPVGNELQK